MAHYFDKKQDSRLETNKIEAILRGNTIRIKTASGVFAKKKVDKGSLLLIEKSIIEDNKRVLDLGCGVGVVGIAIKKAFPKCEVWQSDVNERAVMITRENVRLNHIKTSVVKSDGFAKIQENFDIVLLNPPQTAGKKVCFKLVEDSLIHLKENGNLQLVIRSQKGGKQMAAFMKDVFGNVETIARGSGYRILVSKKE